MSAISDCLPVPRPGCLSESCGWVCRYYPSEADGKCEQYLSSLFMWLFHMIDFPLSLSLALCACVCAGGSGGLP